MRILHGEYGISAMNAARNSERSCHQFYRDDFYINQSILRIKLHVVQSKTLHLDLTMNNTSNFPDTSRDRQDSLISVTRFL